MKKVILLMGIVALVFGCKSSNEKQPESFPDNSQNSLDWEGTYVGTVPCADCEGIDFMLELNKNNTFSLIRTYLVTPEDTFTLNGTFVWNDKGSVITLKTTNDKEKFAFKVGEGRLFYLDQDGKEVKGDLEQNYILDKVDISFQGKHWKLVELMGSPVTTPEGGKEAFITFQADGKVHGNYGCNSFNGTYSIRKGDRIHFSQMISTMMMCANMDTENLLKDVLNTADNYNYIGENTLVLNRARMAPLARFTAEQ